MREGDWSLAVNSITLEVNILEVKSVRVTPLLHSVTKLRQRGWGDGEGVTTTRTTELHSLNSLKLYLNKKYSNLKITRK